MYKRQSSPPPQTTKPFLFLFSLFFRSFTLALLGIEALDLQSVDCPEELAAHHALFRDFNVDDPSARQVARDRLGAVNEVLASMVDPSKSERSAVRLELCCY